MCKQIKLSLLTWYLFIETEASDNALKQYGREPRAKRILLRTAIIVKACKKKGSCKLTKILLLIFIN